MDPATPRKRSESMWRARSQDTRPETGVRRLVHPPDYRSRLQKAGSGLIPSHGVPSAPEGNFHPWGLVTPAPRMESNLATKSSGKAEVLTEERPPHGLP